MIAYLRKLLGFESRYEVVLYMKSGNVIYFPLLKSIKVTTGTTNGAVTKLDWVYATPGRQLLDIQLSQIEAITTKAV